MLYLKSKTIFDIYCKMKMCIKNSQGRYKVIDIRGSSFSFVILAFHALFNVMHSYLRYVSVSDAV